MGQLRQPGPVIETVRAERIDALRSAFPNYPLTELHAHALLAAEAAEAAGAQGKYWEMHAILFEHQKHLTLEGARDCAEQIGLDTARFMTELESGTYTKQVLADFARRVRSGVNGTPTLFINGERHDALWFLHTVEAAASGKNAIDRDVRR
jgi:formate-nitrite transporter family protein